MTTLEIVWMVISFIGMTPVVVWYIGEWRGMVKCRQYWKDYPHGTEG